MRTTMFDFTPLSRFGIGFDRMLDLLDGVTQADTAEGYPPYDIEKTGEDAYRISLAVAGFRPNELSITTEPNLLVVTDNKADSEGEAVSLPRHCGTRLRAAIHACRLRKGRWRAPR